MDAGFPNRLRKAANEMRNGDPGDGVPMALDGAADEIEGLKKIISGLITGPSRSVALISPKLDQFHPMEMTVTKGQILEALKAIK